MHNYLLFREIIAAQQLIEGGAIGEVRTVTVDMLGVVDSPGTSGYRPNGCTPPQTRRPMGADDHMDLCLYTDSVPDLTLEQALDLTVRIGGATVEIAAGGQSSAPHMDVFSPSPTPISDSGSRTPSSPAACAWPR
jgi:hypothetical protein